MTATSMPADAVVALLDAERANLLAQVERVPAAHRGARVAEGQWSAAEIVEHVARVEGWVAWTIGKRAGEGRTATAAEIAEGQLTPARAAAVRVRGAKLEAPERVRPTGALTPDEAMTQLAASGAALRLAFRSADSAVLDGAMAPHPFLGPLTMRAWVELIAHHDARHAAQVADVADHWLAVR